MQAVLPFTYLRHSVSSKWTKDGDKFVEDRDHPVVRLFLLTDDGQNRPDVVSMQLEPLQASKLEGLKRFDEILIEARFSPSRDGRMKYDFVSFKGLNK